MTMARVDLPGGGTANHAWGLLSEPMRTSFRVTLDVNGPTATRLVVGKPGTLVGLARRGLVDPVDRARLTPSGRRVLKWIANPTGIGSPTYGIGDEVDRG